MDIEGKMRKLKILSLCDGISCGLMAFKALKVPVEYHAVENNKLTRIISDSNFKEVVRFENDVENVTKKMIKENGPFDWVIMGPTCKSVSAASNGPGLFGSSKILFDCIKIRDWVLSLNPKAKWLIENVKMKDQYYNDFCSVIGEEAYLLNSANVSGQERLRYYWTNFEVTDLKIKNIFLNDILENPNFGAVAWSKSGRYRDNKGKVHQSPGPGKKYFVEERFKEINKANTLMATKYCKGQSTETRVWINKSKTKFRYLTVRECARLQTVPEKIKFDMVSETKAYRTIGDGWTVDVIKHLIKCGLKC